MKKVSVKNLSLLGLVLMAASAVTAAVVPDNSNGKRVNNGTLRIASASAGADIDAPDAVSCVDIGQGASCTATASLTTTGANIGNESRLLIGELYYQTVGNTSQTGAVSGDQNSVLVEA